MKFAIETILSISHSKLLTEIGNVYEILNYMLDDNLFTHQLPRASRFCEKFIRAQYPQLDDWDFFNEQVSTENYKEYIEKAKAIFGNELEIEKVPAGTWTFKDPISEAEEHFSKDSIITIKTDTQQSEGK